VKSIREVSNIDHAPLAVLTICDWRVDAAYEFFGAPAMTSFTKFYVDAWLVSQSKFIGPWAVARP
jgi:hypothetical protein